MKKQVLLNWFRLRLEKRRRQAPSPRDVDPLPCRGQHAVAPAATTVTNFRALVSFSALFPLVVTLFVSLLFAGLLAPTAAAQVNSRWSFGIKGGISISTVNAQGDWNSTDYRVGADLAGFVQWRVAFPTAISAELHYFQKGYKGPEMKIPEDPGVTIGAFRVDYLSVPLLLKYDMPVGKLPTYLLAGPHFSFQINEAPLVERRFADSLESFVFGATVGFGHHWSVLPNLALLVEVTYNHDFTEALDVNGTLLSNRTFAVVVGLRFD